MKLADSGVLTQWWGRLDAEEADDWQVTQGGSRPYQVKLHTVTFQVEQDGNDLRLKVSAYGHRLRRDGTQTVPLWLDLRHNCPAYLEALIWNAASTRFPDVKKLKEK